MRSSLVAVIALTLGLLITSPAHAGERPNHDPLATQFVTMAETFWTDRGVPVCRPENLDVQEADDLSEGESWERATGRADLGGCRVWLLSSLVANAESGAPGNDQAIFLCRVVTHELGHTGGLLDAGSGVMDPAADWKDGTPAFCIAWSHQQIQAERFAAHRVSLFIRHHARKVSEERRAREASSRSVSASSR